LRPRSKCLDPHWEGIRRLRDWLTARPIAHRGLHNAAAGIIENTASAFQAAIDDGYGIECDVQISADGEAMVHHDDALGRLTDGSGSLDAMTCAELKRVPFRASTDRMLTLGELCDLVGGRTTLVVELKRRTAGDVRLAARTAEVLGGRPHQPIATMSFEPALMAELRRLAPALPRGLVAMRQEAESDPDVPSMRWHYARDLIAARPQFLAYRVQDLTSPPPLIARHLLRWPLLTWTVRTEADRARAACYADQIIFEGFRA
jgi:glycerophosphoryl diester phosphodiesterase